MKTLRLFIASPGDVAEERALVRTVVAEVNSMLKRASADVQWEALGWEKDVRPGLDEGGPQGKIDSEIDFASLDIVLGIFWQRFGTIVKGEDSGTTHEIRRAFSLWKEKKRPDIWLYFRNEARQVNTGQDAEQVTKVLRFREEFQQYGIYQSYGAPIEFERSLRMSLFDHGLRQSQRDAEWDLEYHTSAHYRHAASEGFTEETGQIEVVLSASPALIGKSVVLGVSVFVNTAITNRIDGQGLSDVTLAMASGAALGHGTVSGNTMTFANIPITFGASKAVKFFIRGVFVNAAGVGLPGAIHAAVLIEAEGLRVAPASGHFPIVAVPGPALAFWATTETRANLPVRCSSLSPGDTAVIHLHFREGFREAFQFPSGSGIGTRFKLIFFDIPTGVSIYVSTMPVRASWAAYLLADELSQQAAPSDEIHAGTPLSRLRPQQAMSSPKLVFNAEATWQLLGPLPADVHSHELLCVIRCEADVLRPARIAMLAGLAPNPTSGQFTASSGSAASTTLARPRYSSKDTKRLDLLEIAGAIT